MARVIPKYRKNESVPYAYNIRVFRGKDAQNEIERLQKMSQSTGTQIEQMKQLKAEKVEEYSAIEDQIPEDMVSSVQMERMSIRPLIVSSHIEEWGTNKYNTEATKFDHIMGCSGTLYSTPSTETIKLN